MKKAILIVKNITREGPGLLEDILITRQIKYTIVDLDQGQTFPDVQNYAALVVLGGPDSANDSNEKIQTELKKINEARQAGIPYLGICLGLQALVKTLGGSVVKNPVREIGWRDPDNNYFSVQLTEAGKKDPLFAGLGDSFKVFHLHGETVALTSDMALLATGKFCHNQVVKIGSNAYGIQCHVELTPELFNIWLNQDPDLLVLNKKSLQADFASIQKEYTHAGQKLLENFLKIAGF